MRYSCAPETMPLIDGEEAVVLHQHRRLHAGQVRAHRDADAFFFLGQPDERDVRVVVGQPDQVHEPRLGQRRHQPDAAGLERIEDDLRIGRRNRHQGGY